jgi:SAM-dependent methyltransferase
MSPEKCTEPGKPASNVDAATIASFGAEWAHFDQSTLPKEELLRLFEGYFGIFPWHLLTDKAQGFDMGCGSGRWAKLVAPRVGRLNCIDPSGSALAVARRTLADHQNVQFYQASVDAVPLVPGSQDFGYSLGVMHHIPDTHGALRTCVGFLKPGAPFLVYLYYRFDNRPVWFRVVWRVSEGVRAVVARLPSKLKPIVTDMLAALVYWPLARLASFIERLGLSFAGLPLSFYRNTSFYTMRTDSRDRFGTPLEQRFTRAEIMSMMDSAGLSNIRFSEVEPYWVAVGFKRI